MCGVMTEPAHQSQSKSDNLAPQIFALKLSRVNAGFFYAEFWTDFGLIRKKFTAAELELAAREVEAAHSKGESGAVLNGVRYAAPEALLREFLKQISSYSVNGGSDSQVFGGAKKAYVRAAQKESARKRPRGASSARQFFKGDSCSDNSHKKASALSFKLRRGRSTLTVTSK